MSFPSPKASPSKLFKFGQGSPSPQRLLRKSSSQLLFSSGKTNEIHILVKANERKKLKKILSKKKAKTLILEADEQNLTPLLWALKKEFVDMVELILNYYTKSKIDINEKDKDGFAPVHFAVTVGTEKSLIPFLKYDELKVDICNEDLTTPLHYFCQKFPHPSCQPVFDLLISRGANINAQNKNGETPLHKAVLNPTVRMIMVKLLVSHPDINLNLQTVRGDTALHYVVNLGRDDLVSLLLKSGSDPFLEDNSQRKPYDLSIALKQPHIATRLKNVMDTINFLKEIDMLEYQLLFLREELYPDVLANSTYLGEDFLEKVGITVAGHRLKILQGSKQSVVEDHVGTIFVPPKPISPDRRRSVSAENVITVNRPRARSGSVDELRFELSRLDHLKDDNSWIIRQENLEFIERIGVGGGGKVYKGLLNGKTQVAIKVLKQLTEEKLLDEFKKEVEIMSSIRSPEIVHFYGMCFEPKLCMVMEYCGRGSLYHVMNDLKVRFSWDLVLSFMMQMTNGLEVLHSWHPQIVHRDVKSLNILVTDNWSLKVADFGLSRFATPDNIDTLEKLRGTPVYCSPEVIMGAKFTVKSDVYGMGMVMWEMVTRCIKGEYEKPFSEFTDLVYDFQILMNAAQQGKRPTIHENCPAILKNLMERCWDPKPEARPDCKEILDILFDAQREFQDNKLDWNSRKLRSSKSAPQLGCDTNNNNNNNEAVTLPSDRVAAIHISTPSNDTSSCKTFSE